MLPENYKARFEPRSQDFCLCGSGLAFRICCQGKYRAGDIAAITAELKAGKATAALEKCRQFLTWYRLSHLAHTVPFLRSGTPASRKLLETDIEALEEISELLLECLVAAGVPEGSVPLFASIESAVDDPRWREAVFALRVVFAWHHLGEDATWQLLSTSPQFATNTRPDVFMAWMSCHPEGTTISQRLAVVARLRQSTTRADVQMFCALVEGAFRSTDPNDTSADGVLSQGIAEFRKVPEAKRTSFGVLKFSQALNILGFLAADNVLLEESITESQRYLQMSAGIPNEFAATVLHECGEVCLALGQPARAIAFLGSALREDAASCLPMIHLAKAHALLGSIPDVRLWLARAAPLLKSEANKLDFAYASAQLALLTKLPADITEARNQLVGCQAGIGIFEKRRLAYLHSLADLSVAPPAEEPKAGIIAWLNRYLMLEPNVMGFGLRINNMIEDGVKAHRKAQEKRGR